MKYLLLLLLLAGCATPITVNRTVSDVLLAKTKTISTPVIIEIASDLPDDHKVTFGYAIISNANSSFKPMVKEYMDAKFAKQGEGSFKVKVRLQYFDIEQNMDKGFTNTIAILASTGAEATAKASVRALIEIEKNGTAVGSKVVVASSEKNYNTASPNSNSILSDNMNAAFNKFLLMTDSYLDSVKF